LLCSGKARSKVVHGHQIFLKTPPNRGSTDCLTPDFTRHFTPLSHAQPPTEQYSSGASASHPHTSEHTTLHRRPRDCTPSYSLRPVRLPLSHARPASDLQVACLKGTTFTTLAGEQSLGVCTGHTRSGPHTEANGIANKPPSQTRLPFLGSQFAPHSDHFGSLTVCTAHSRDTGSSTRNPLQSSLYRQVSAFKGV